MIPTDAYYIYGNKSGDSINTNVVVTTLNIAYVSETHTMLIPYRSIHSKSTIVQDGAFS